MSRIFNNLSHDNYLDGLSCVGMNAGAASRFRVFQNTIYNNGANGILLDGLTDDAVLLVAIFNNLITHNTGYGVNAIGTVTYDPGLGEVNYNNSWNNTAGIHNIGGFWGTRNISADPDYKSTTLGDADFLKIQTSSTCIDQGGDSSPYGTWPDDFWGDPRPYDHPAHDNPYSYYDIGCDEYYVPVQQLDRFVISHDGYGFIGTPEKITITAYNTNNQIIFTNIGIITVYVPNAIGIISWSNGGNNGTYWDVGTYFIYEFDNLDNGVATFYLTDTSEDTLDIEVSTSWGTNTTIITDDDTEGPLYIAGIPDIAITKTKLLPAGDPGPGGYIRYRIDYVNNGGTAYNVEISDLMPNHTTYSSGSMDDLSGSLTDGSGDDAGYFTGIAYRLHYRQ